jgi:hypothetical protein
VVKLKGKGFIGLTINEYIALSCSVETNKVGSQFPIRKLKNLGLKIIVSTISQVVGSTSLHQASRTMVYYAREFLRPILYD